MKVKQCPFCGRNGEIMDDGKIRCMNLICPLGELMVSFIPIAWNRRANENE